MKAIVYGNDDPNKAYPVGSYTLADLQRDQICSTTLTLRSYFSVFGDIAKMWITLSKENVLPGLGLGDEIANPRQEQSLGVIAPKMRKLSQWSQEATARVKVRRSPPLETSRSVYHSQSSIPLPHPQCSSSILTRTAESR